MTDVMLTRKDIEKLYKITKSTLYRWIENGGFPKPVRYNSAVVRWKQSDVTAWEEKNQSTA